MEQKRKTDKEKSRFHEMADKDKKRYDSEMLTYTLRKAEKMRGKKRKHTKEVLNLNGSAYLMAALPRHVTAPSLGSCGFYRCDPATDHPPRPRVAV
jgi:hypothetical protein